MFAAKIQPKVKILKMWEVGMQIFGLGRPTSRLPESLAQVIRFFMVLGGICFLAATAMVIMLDSKTFLQKLEAAYACIVGYSCIHKFFVLAARRSEIFEVVDRLNLLLGEIEVVYGSETLLKYQKFATYVMVYYSTQYVFLTVPVSSYMYYMYYVVGDHDALPYEMWVPFSQTTPGYVTWVCIYEVLVSIPAGFGVAFASGFFGALTSAVVLVLSKIRDQCEQLNQENSKLTMKRIVDWHSEIILIVADVNRLLGTIYFVEYVMGCAHVSCSGYIIMKAGVDANPNLKKNIICCSACIILPLFIAICGHIIKIQNEKLSRSIFENEWWQMQPRNKVDLLLPSVLAYKGLSLNYRELVTFDMSLYAKILQQSYSFLTVLKMMDNN